VFIFNVSYVLDFFLETKVILREISIITQGVLGIENIKELHYNPCQISLRKKIETNQQDE